MMNIGLYINFDKLIGDVKEKSGFVAKIKSSKAKREERGEGGYRYSLDTELPGYQQEDGTYRTTSGLFMKCSICMWSDKLQWNFYLIVVEDDGKAYVAAEYLDSPYTQWVIEARKVVKQYFDGEVLDPIEVTSRPTKVITSKSFNYDYSGVKDEEQVEADEKVSKETKPSKKSKKVVQNDDSEEGFISVYRKNGNMYRSKVAIIDQDEAYISVNLKGKEVKFRKSDGKSDEVSYTIKID